jgi:putative tricarboxylic transport membrane protein
MTHLRRWLPALVAALATIAIVLTASHESAAGTTAQRVLGHKQLRILAPAALGGGWDQTARAMQESLRELVGRTEVSNVPGGGGTIGLSQFVRHDGDPSQLMTTGLIMIGAVVANHSQYLLDDTTPLVRLTTDYQVVVVPKNSKLTKLADVARAMKSDLPAVSVAGGSAGGAEQILAGLMAKAAGANPAQLSYVAHSGGGEMLSTLLSGRSTIAISGVSEIKPQIHSGDVRALAVSSPERLEVLPDVPTMREAGMDIQLQNWRGVVAPKGISEEQERAVETLLVEMTKTETWQDILTDRGWGEATLAGAEFEAFVRAEEARVSQVLDEIGLGERVD